MFKIKLLSASKVCASTHLSERHEKRPPKSEGLVRGLNSFNKTEASHVVNNETYTI